jgi:hypothetical protein
VIVNLGFHTQKKFTKIVSNLGSRPQERSPALALGRKGLKKMYFDEGQVIIRRGHSSFGPILALT